MNDTINPILQAGFGAHQDGELDIAAENYLHVLGIAPDHPDALHLLGLVRLQKGDPAEAVTCIEKSLIADPENPQALDHLGTAHQQLGQFAKAIAVLENALSIAPDFADCWFNLGNAKESAGDLSGAVTAYREATALQPDFAAAHANMGNALVECRAFNDALEALDYAIAQEPDLAPAWLSRGNALRGLGRAADAIAAYQKALTHDPESSAVQCLIADCHHDLDQEDKAYEHFKAALLLNADDHNALIGLAYCQMRQSDFTAAGQSLEDALSRAPGDRRALAYKTVLLNLSDRSLDARALSDFDHDIAMLSLKPPEGYATITEFNAVLSAALRTDHSLRRDPDNKTTRGGLQSGELSTQPTAVIRQFHECLRAALDDYISTLKIRPDRAEFDAAPMDYRLESWSTILDAEGHQLAHIHPTAWMSGVYYVALPPELSDDDASHKGWLEFGASGYGLPAHAGAIRLVPPHEGHMVLFPSYFLHRTVPFQSNTQRISIAFDLIPID